MQRQNLKICNKCDQVLEVADFYTDPTHKDGRQSRCKECVKIDRRAYYKANREKVIAFNKMYYEGHKDQWLATARKLRERVLDEYGRMCACCGETTPQFLTVDHVNDDGAEHRKTLGGYGRAIYRWLEKEGFPKDGRFQLLCHNCNQAKGLYGECPHGTMPCR